MNIDAVFSGGGVKAYAFLGALERIKEENLTIVRSGGTSAGAIISGFIAAGYQVEDIKRIVLELELEKFLDPPPLTKYIPFGKWILFHWKMGFYKGDKLEEWLFNLLNDKGVNTFKDLQNGVLKMVVSDLTLGKLIVMPDDLQSVYGINPDHFPVATAIRMSAGFPYFFMPKRIGGTQSSSSLMVDGGLLSNFPLWIFGKSPQKKRPLLGVHLEDESDSDEDPPIKNSLDMLQALVVTMKEAHDTRYVEQSQVHNLISIPVSSIPAMNLSINADNKQQLIELGYKEAAHFLSAWP